jgi:acyltransferase
MLLIAKMTRPRRTIVWLGQNTLILMCLNGIFYHYINPPMAKWMLASFPPSAIMILALGSIMTAISLTLCIPLVFAFNAVVPQLTGKPRRRGPLLKNLI